MNFPACKFCVHHAHGCTGDCTPEGQALWDTLFALDALLDAEERERERAQDEGKPLLLAPAAEAEAKRAA